MSSKQIFYVLVISTLASAATYTAIQKIPALKSRLG